MCGYNRVDEWEDREVEERVKNVEHVGMKERHRIVRPEPSCVTSVWENCSCFQVGRKDCLPHEGFNVLH